MEMGCDRAEVEGHCGSQFPAPSAPRSPVAEDTAASACATAAARVLAQAETNIAALAGDSIATYLEVLLTSLCSHSSCRTVAAVVPRPEEQAARCHMPVRASEPDLAAQMQATAGTCCSAA